ncbi:MazG nucleotide pyrophosphohydrolase domain-containing protein [Rhizobium sp. RU36D]|uniref:MazG nucleotide pyrophosphohydrolase domain-containing protein n=1 Tax=Rhizobium sp. RU36D TaxID=1907415 RepID=UPI0009D7D14C|nr:MazG nucleotide pyrophosphohydrolase domain-containing protein [Rhizobium sp. RU36D]SMC91404.1 NTP pyrophosphatase, house-cleaning of non-canonical NTPs [Rhizobium sp. RU36D]
MRDLMEKFEAASAAYADSHGLTRDSDWFLLKLLEETGELTQAANRVSGRARLKGRSAADLHQSLADETADLLGHILLFARHHGIDLDAAIERKWRFKIDETAVSSIQNVRS